jgi:hypothetical protein
VHRLKVLQNICGIGQAQQQYTQLGVILAANEMK